MLDYSTTALLASIKRRGMLTDNPESLSDADILNIANDELQTFVVPLLMSVREEYFVTYLDTAIVAGTTDYALPQRAIGGKLRNVLVGDTTNGFVPLLRIEPEQAWRYGTSGGTAGYTVRGNSVVLVPSPSSASTLRMEYFRRPGALVTVAASTTVSTVAAPNVVTTATIPATMTTSAPLDGILAYPTFETTFSDITPSVASGTSLRLATLGSLAAGDYVCLAGASCVPQIPVELHPLLAQRTVLKIWEAQGNPNAKSAQAIGDEMAKHAMTLITPRVEGGARYLINRNAPGFSRGR